jgi:hypothetical protein
VRVGAGHQEQVHVVGPHAQQRLVEAVEQGASGGVHHAAGAAVGPGLGADAGLGGEHELLPRHLAGEEGADDALGVTVGVAGGGVDEGAAGVEKVPYLLRRVDLVGVAAPRHGPEPQFGDP